MNATSTMGNKIEFVSIAVAAALVGALGLGGAATAFADGEQVDAGSYSYLKGQMEVSDRMADVTDEDTDGNTDSDGNAYAEGVEYSYKAGAERGAGYADADHEDAEALVEEGVIESIDDIDAYAAEKHGQISNRFEGLDSMSATERHEHFSQYSHDAYAGDTLEELQSEGLAD